MNKRKAMGKHGTSHKQHGIDAAVIFRVVGDLCVLAPHDFATRRHQTELAHIDLYDCTLGDNAELREEWAAWILLDTDDWQGKRRLELQHVSQRSTKMTRRKQRPQDVSRVPSWSAAPSGG